MNVKDFKNHRAELFSFADLVQDLKGKDYSGEEDVFTNFKTTANDVNLHKYKAWYVFAKKHFDAIASYCKNEGAFESEPIEERLVDAINYITLLSGMIKEDEK